jgi:hypothetical protein
MSTTQEAAVAAVDAAIVAGYYVAALHVFDTLDTRAGELTLHDREAFADEAWFEFIEGKKFTSEQFVTLAARAVAHLGEVRFVDFIDAMWVDEPREIRLDNGSGIDWDPEHRRVTLLWPVLGQVVEHHFGRRRHA